MNVLATLTCRDNAGQPLTFSLTPGTPAWVGQGSEDASVIAETLESLFPLRHVSPADGLPGTRQALGAARWLKQRLGFTEVSVAYPESGSPTEEERVY